MPNLDTIPPEIALEICEHLVNSQNPSNKKDLLRAHATHPNLSAGARVVLFRNITVTFALQSDLPTKLQPWQPRAWKVPDLVRGLQGSSGLWKHVKSLRLRLYYFPVEDWTKDRFDDIKGRLKIHEREWQRYKYVMSLNDGRRSLSSGVPRTVEGRQRWVIDAYRMLFLWRSHWAPAWAQDLGPLLQQFLVNLPGLDHIETARAERGDYFLARHPMDWSSLSYTDTLVFSAAVPRIRSICFRGWPFPAMPRDHSQVAGQGNATIDIRRMQEIVRTDTRIETLTMDGSVHDLLSHHPSPYDPPNPSPDIWRQGLRQLRHVTNLTLAQIPRPQLPSELIRLAISGNIDPDLELLLHKALVLDNVKTLTLIHWILPAPFLAREISPLLPLLETLRLRSVAIFSDSHQQGNELWDFAMKGVRRDGEVRVVVEKPKFCVNFGTSQFSEFEVVPMKKRAVLALESR